MEDFPPFFITIEIGKLDNLIRYILVLEIKLKILILLF